jgi:hypothetical protein
VVDELLMAALKKLVLGELSEIWLEQFDKIGLESCEGNAMISSSD